MPVWPKWVGNGPVSWFPPKSLKANTFTGIINGWFKGCALKWEGEDFEDIKINYLGPLHTRDWEPVTVTLQAFSLVEKVELVQVCSTLCLRNQRSMWMQGGCKVNMESSMALNGITFHGHLDYCQKPPLGGRPNTNPGDHGTPNAHNHWFILFYHVWGPAWIKIHWKNIWLRAQSHDFTLHFSLLCPSIDCLFKRAAHYGDIVGSSPNKPIFYSLIKVMNIKLK